MLLLAALKDKSAPFCGFQVEDGIGLEAGADHIEWGSEGEGAGGSHFLSIIHGMKTSPCLERERPRKF